ncbi:YdcF family protein [Chitinimonas sp. PSY-7]|uniref:ElyC/SanA/YdcF family protein n=1 Tax=Chitinimonas sp. PSY-7 TaxID=3459088 RepID=UPI0040401BB6
MLFWLKKLIASLLLPPTFPLLLGVLGLYLLKRRPRTGRVLIGMGLFAVWFFSTPVTVNWMAAPLEQVQPPDSAALQTAQAIVVLGGGRDPVAPEYGGESVSQYTLARLRYAARLARQTHLPLLLTGGAPSGGRPEAELMAESLQLDFGLQARWVEDASLDTRDNAVFSAALLKSARVQRILLVSDASHLPRARVEFERLGFAVIDAPTRYLAGNLGTRFTWLPSAGAAQAGRLVAHEWLGLLALQLRPGE